MISQSFIGSWKSVESLYYFFSEACGFNCKLATTLQVLAAALAPSFNLFESIRISSFRSGTLLWVGASWDCNTAKVEVSPSIFEISADMSYDFFLGSSNLLIKVIFFSQFSWTAVSTDILFPWKPPIGYSQQFPDRVFDPLSRFDDCGRHRKCNRPARKFHALYCGWIGLNTTTQVAKRSYYLSNIFIFTWFLFFNLLI